MQRYFATYLADENVFSIKGEDCHHISRVMRLRENDEIICVSEDRKTAKCSITKITDEEVLAFALKWMEESVELPVEVTIVSGLPKGDKLEWIIQKGTELGATRFVPLIAARSIVKWDASKAEKKISRWQKIAKEAAEQSHRTIIPQVTHPIQLKSLLELGEQYDVKLIAYEESAKQGERSVLASVLNKIKFGDKLLVVFGPEGGLADVEVEQMTSAGFVACGLGPRILRTETAPLYLLSALSYQIELLR